MAVNNVRHCFLCNNIGWTTWVLPRLHDAEVMTSMHGQPVGDFVVHIRYNVFFFLLMLGSVTFDKTNNDHMLNWVVSSIYLFHHNALDRSFPIEGVVVSFFIIKHVFLNIPVFKLTVSDLGLHYLPMSLLWDAMHLLWDAVYKWVSVE